MGIISSIAAALFGCGFFTIICMPSAQPHNTNNFTSASVLEYATSSPEVTVVTTVNGSTTREVIPAPYGVETSFVESSNGATSTSESSTTPLTAQDVAKMQQQMEAQEAQMNHLFADQEKLFEDMWNSGPSL